MFIFGVINEVNVYIGNIMFYWLCCLYFDGYCNCDVLVLFVDVGVDIYVWIFDVCIVDSFWICYGGFIFFYGLIYDVWFFCMNDELESLVYLINWGVLVFIVDSNCWLVLVMVYIKIIYDKKCNVSFCYIGGYRGDLWDVILVICGYDFLEFCKDYFRLLRYWIDYERLDFERFWKGIEYFCFYWDDCRWFEVGGDGDYWMDLDEFDLDIMGLDVDLDSLGGCEL